MSLRRRMAAASLAVSLAWSSRAAADDAHDPPTAPTTPTAPAASGHRGDIEDVELDKLLDVKLEEKLGTTTAVSRRTESVLRAPATITTLDADRIRLSGATTVVDLLRWVPGVQVVQHAPGNWSVSLRGAGGLAGNDLVVLVDGMSMNSPLDGSVSWDLFPVNVADIERVEVVRGPVSTIYGPNAYTGVINIVTRTTDFSPTAIAARSLAGVDSEGRAMTSSGGRIAHTGDRLQVAWYWNIRYDRTNAGSAPLIQPGWAATGTAGRLSYQLTKTSKLSLQLALSRSTRSELDHLVTESETQGRVQLLALTKYEQSGLLDGHMAFDVWARTHAQSTDQPPHLETDFDYGGTRARRSEGGGDIFLKFARLSASAGATVTGERINAAYINPADNAQTRFGYGVFASATASPARILDLSIAARGDAPPTLARLEGSYRASAVLHWETTAIRLSAGSSYRAPSWVEGAGRFVDPATGLILLEGTPSIAPPRNDSVELGVVWGPSVNLELKPTIYASRLTNVMVQDFASLVRKTFRNDPFERIVLGGELEASWRIRENVQLRGWGGVLSFPNAPAATATVGVPDQNSALTGGGRVQATLWSERVGCAFGARTASSRSYSVRAGIPPQILAQDVPDVVALEAMSELRPFRSEPFWTSLRVQSNLPHGIRESPLPNASGLGTVVMLGLEYRRE